MTDATPTISQLEFAERWPQYADRGDHVCAIIDMTNGDQLTLVRGDHGYYLDHDGEAVSESTFAYPVLCTIVRSYPRVGPIMTVPVLPSGQ